MPLGRIGDLIDETLELENTPSLIQMCLIVHRPPGLQLPDVFVSAAHAHNPDGWGWAFARSNGIEHERGMGLEALLDALGRLPSDVELLVHLRKATAGPVTPELAHPFVVQNGLVLMHNGTLEHLKCDENRVSDSYRLAQMLDALIGARPDEDRMDFVRGAVFRRLVEPLIEGSRVVLLDSAGPVFLGDGWHRLSTSHEGAPAGLRLSNLTSWARAPAMNALSHR